MLATAAAKALAATCHGLEPWNQRLVQGSGNASSQMYVSLCIWMQAIVAKVRFAASPYPRWSNGAPKHEFSDCPIRDQFNVVFSSDLAFNPSKRVGDKTAWHFKQYDFCFYFTGRLDELSMLAFVETLECPLRKSWPPSSITTACGFAARIAGKSSKASLEVIPSLPKLTTGTESRCWSSSG